MVHILGLNAYHADSSACLVSDGALVAAAEEERFLRVKHWAGFPEQAIRYCLAEAGIGLGQVDHIAINRDPSANLWRKALFSLRRCSDLSARHFDFCNGSCPAREIKAAPSISADSGHFRWWVQLVTASGIANRTRLALSRRSR